MGKVIDKLKDDLQSIIYSPDLIHSKEFMMGQLKGWEEELPEFEEYQRETIEEKRMLYFNAPGQEEAYLMKELIKGKKHDTHFGKISCYNGRGMDWKNG